MKIAFREKLRAERAAAFTARPDASKHAARHFISNITIPVGAVVAIYHPLKDELDTKPLAQALLDNGVPLALPVVTGTNEPLIFKAFKEGDDLVQGAFGVMTPTDAAPTIIPSIVVTPLLGFTKKGLRLGYGGGFYDRTLANLKQQGDVLAVGFAFGAQELNKLPQEPTDQYLDWIVTERGAFKTNRPNTPDETMAVGWFSKLMSTFRF
ncbi:MAG: 5-formyltetrahydrofolate cyclo-ligase [Pseudomonadota bacterium]